MQQWNWANLETFTDKFTPWVWRNRPQFCYSWAMNEHNTLLLVDDDPRWRELLVRYLETNDFVVKQASDGVAMFKILDREHVDGILLDMMMPGDSGLELCRKLRGQGDNVPILMLTAKGDEVDRIVGLEIGADDYISKSASPREILARIRAVMRRVAPVAPGAPRAGEVIEFGEFRLDPVGRTLTKNNDVVNLTSGEFAVLDVLVRNPGQTLSRDRVIHLARGRSAGSGERSVDTMIGRLRKVIEQDPNHPKWIQTVWGKGYVFTPIRHD